MSRQIVAAKPEKHIRQSLTIPALPAFSSRTKASDVDLLYDEIASCHVTKKIKLSDGSAQISKQELVDAVIREHKVLNAVAPPTTAESTGANEPAWFQAALKTPLEKLKEDLKEDLKKGLKEGLSGIKQSISRMERRSFNERAYERNLRVLTRNDAKDALILPLNRLGVQPGRRSPKHARDIDTLSKARIQELSLFYQANICNQRTPLSDARNNLRLFLLKERTYKVETNFEDCTAEADEDDAVERDEDNAIERDEDNAIERDEDSAVDDNEASVVSENEEQSEERPTKKPQRKQVGKV